MNTWFTVPLMSFVVAVMCMTSAPKVHAQSSPEEVIKALQEQVAELRALIMERTNAGVSASGDKGFADITRNLYRGTSGGDVRALQEYLSNTGDYTYPEITGYFGQATEAAVKRYQSRMGIVSFGTPASTGFGFVGSQTRASLEGDLLSSNTMVLFNAFPREGVEPFKVTFRAYYLDEGIHYVNFGDGEQERLDTETDELGNRIGEITHVYESYGSYPARLLFTPECVPGSSCPQPLEEIGEIKIRVNEDEDEEEPEADPRLDAFPGSGEAPLAVQFTAEDLADGRYYLDFGDGTDTALDIRRASADDLFIGKARHTYESAGDYTARLSHAPECGNALISCPTVLRDLDSLRIHVYEAEVANEEEEEDEEVIAEDDEEEEVEETDDSAGFSADDTSGTAPVSIMFYAKHVPAGTYYLDPGDNSKTGMQKMHPNCISGGSCPEGFYFASHTYESPGTYTAELLYARSCPSGLSCTAALESVGELTVTIN